jgi:uncharacterized membrane protein YphA (DoxX/SURF4 family)
MTNLKTVQNNETIYWALIVVLAVFFALSGFWEITKNPVTYPKTLQMGYPPYFITALGIAKICGVVALLVPTFQKLKEWAFAGFTFDVIFAFISNVYIANYLDCIKAVVALGLLALTYTLFLKRL